MYSVSVVECINQIRGDWFVEHICIQPPSNIIYNVKSAGHEQQKQSQLHTV